MPEDYAEQINSEIKKQMPDGSWKWTQVRANNHFWDCEAMQVLAACMAGLFGDGEAKKS